MPAPRITESTGAFVVETRKNYQVRVIFFYFVTLGLLLILALGLAWQQLLQADVYHERERQQNERRILVPGPRGNIYDREGRLLVGNRARFAVVVFLDELRREFRREFIRVRKNYRELGDKDVPNSGQLEQIAQVSVVQNYLDQVDQILGRQDKVDSKDLMRHLSDAPLLPYVLIDDLKPEEYARLLEQLPVESPLQVYTSNTRYYPYNSAAAHTLGFVSINEDIDIGDFPGEELKTFSMKGTMGRDGLEAHFDDQLQGETGGSIYRVDYAGFKVDPPIQRRLPIQGHNLTTSLDIDLQLAAEQAIGDYTGAAAAIDVNTGEVLVLASKPDYNLNDFAPRLSAATAQQIHDQGAWLNHALDGTYPPGSTFKLITAIAALRNGWITPDTTFDCEGSMPIGNRTFRCDNGEGKHGVIDLRQAIAKSCDIYFWNTGIQTGVDLIAAEARRFHLDQPADIELPGETHHMLIPDPEWKQRNRDEEWFPGDTANMAIGQGFVLVTPLDMACFAASLARGETVTKPTLIHDPNHPQQHSEPIGLTPAQYAAILDGMKGCITAEGGTAAILALPAFAVPGVTIAGKTGTAQVRKAGGTIDIAWFIGFAPADHPQIAWAVAIEGDTLGESFGGAHYAGPVAAAILKKYFEKQNRSPETKADTSN
ncbi:MAG TPA: penicillin-binding transpeptidase domain-containing protein [Opitutaceae bacterium]|jgi:penicillin-binding protein 2|nr:penicillin-binding transpeptidase domain-containing protein [Opitutaceae bacterium]